MTTNQSTTTPSHADRFRRVWIQLAAAGDSEVIARDLLTRWSEPHRYYHNLNHLDSCIAGLDAHRGMADDGPSIEAALWFHDAVYDPRAPDNEIRSAALAGEVLKRANVSPGRVDRIEKLILATRTHESDGSADTALLLDLDLAILGASPESYTRYAEAIRQEYAWVAEAEYRHKRVAVLERFLNRTALFLTPAFHQRYETQARQNLAAEIASLAAGSTS